MRRGAGPDGPWLSRSPQPPVNPKVMCLAPRGARQIAVVRLGKSFEMAIELIGARAAPDSDELAEGQMDEIALRRLLCGRREWLCGDSALLAELGLRLDAANVVDFGPVALSRVTAAHERESSERKRLEDMAQANYAAQTQTHAAVLDVLEADSLGDLAARVDRLARLRFGLVVGALAVEGGQTPAGWLTLVEGQADALMLPGRDARLGVIPTAAGLFGGHAPAIESVALARLTLWEPARRGVLAFGAFDSEAFTEDMGDELVVFLGRVVERAAVRWPRP
jgi:uncharacterized protein YigA (DUF484 family)